MALTVSSRDLEAVEQEAQEAARPEPTESTPQEERVEQLTGETEEMPAFILLAERAFNPAEEVQAEGTIITQVAQEAMEKS